MQSNDLQLSAKFSEYLASKGQLSALVGSLRQFREKENYIYELESKRIIKQSLTKSYAEILSQIIMTENPENIEKVFQIRKKLILDEVEKDTDIIYGRKTLSIGEELALTNEELAQKNKEITDLKKENELLKIKASSKNETTENKKVKKAGTIPIIEKK